MRARLTAGMAGLCVLIGLHLAVAGARGAEAPPAGVPVNTVTFAAIDTETTGLDPAKGRIVELAVVKFRDGRILARHSWLIDPGIPIPPGVQRLHGITPALVAGQPRFAEVYPLFAAHLHGCVVLAHNASFDRRFLAAEIDRNRLTPPAEPLLDTLPLCRRWFPENRRRTLQSYAAHLRLPGFDPAGLPAAGADGKDGPATTRRFHSALWDTECLAAIVMQGLGTPGAARTLEELMAHARGGQSFQPRPAQSSSASSPPAADPL